MFHHIATWERCMLCLHGLWKTTVCKKCTDSLWIKAQCTRKWRSMIQMSTIKESSYSACFWRFLLVHVTTERQRGKVSKNISQDKHFKNWKTILNIIEQKQKWQTVLGKNLWPLRENPGSRARAISRSTDIISQYYLIMDIHVSGMEVMCANKKSWDRKVFLS